MDMAFSQEVREFRGEVRTFIEANLPSDIRARTERGEGLPRADHMRWHRLLVAKGWSIPNWPVEYGGAGWSLARQYVFHDEMARGYAPGLPWYGWDMLGPLLIEYGTDWQRERFLPTMVSGEEWWCQGFSEPQAGSDLAALQCKAELHGDKYVVNGSKLWTSEAHRSDWMFVLVRTDNTGKKQHGITLLFVPMNAPGLSVQSIPTFDGGRDVNQCFFDDVEVLVACRIGEEHQGWTYAKYLLAAERLGIAGVPFAHAKLERLKRIIDETASGPSRSAIEDRIARAEISLRALEVTELRYLFETESGSDLGSESSILKIHGSVLAQELCELTLAAYPGQSIAALDPDDALRNNFDAHTRDTALAAATSFNARKLSIYGGSNEIQRGIVAKTVLGL